MALARTARVRIEGRVQGVGYRAWLAGVARECRLVGWVRNRRDGSVEAVIQGRRDAVEAVISRCWNGPRNANVTRVEVIERQENVFEGFEVRPTV